MNGLTESGVDWSFGTEIHLEDICRAKDRLNAMRPSYSANADTLKRIGEIGGIHFIENKHCPDNVIILSQPSENIFELPKIKVFIIKE